MDSVFSWVIITVFALYGMFKFFCAALNELEQQKENRDKYWGFDDEL